jgi:hypothetical protein
MFFIQATTVFENSDIGDILCAVCPNSKIFITAGTSTVSKITGVNLITPWWSHDLIGCFTFSHFGYFSCKQKFKLQQSKTLLPM